MGMIFLRNRVSGAAPADFFSIGGASPELVAAFTTQSDGTTAGEYYRKASSETTFSGLFTFSRSGTATYFDSNGTLQTAADGVARTQAYRYNSGWELAGMQMEAAAATNLALYSTDFSQWTAPGANINQTANQANGPRGANTMTKLSAQNGLGSHYARDLFSLVTGNNVFSYFVKSAGEGVHPQIRATGEGGGFAFVNFDIDNGTVGNSGGTNLGLTGIDDFGGGLYRIWAVINHTASGNGALLALCETPATDGELPVFSNDGAGFYCDIAQVEAGNVPSSPIITTGSTVTRAAETLTIAGADSPISATEATLAADVLLTSDGNGPEMFNITSGANWVRIYPRNVASTYAQWRPSYTPEVTAAQGGTISAGINQPVTVALGIKASDEVQLVAQGNAGTAVATTTITDFSGQDIGINGNIGEGSFFYKTIRIWSTKLPAADLVTAGTAS